MSQLNASKYLSELECSQFEKTLERFKTDSIRDYLVLSLTYRTGARSEEIRNVKVCDLNPDQHSVFIRGIKGSLDREIPLEKKFFNELYKFCQGKELNSLIFDIGYHRLRDIWVMYRPVKKCFHSLRHTRAVFLYKATKDIYLVKSLLGHLSVQSTMVYMTYCYTQQELRRILL